MNDKMVFKYISILLLFSFVNTLSRHPILIVVSYDAFRFDYVNSDHTPYIQELFKKGVSTHHITSIMPTKTFPNHFSIATGLYADVHGVIGNKIYSYELKKVISNSYEMYHFNDKVEPIWIRNEKADYDRHSGVMMWPGGEFDYQKVQPTFKNAWNKSVSMTARIDTIINWLNHPETPANLIFLYYEQPDEIAHMHGINSDTFNKTLNKIDEFTKYLDDQLKIHGIYDQVNIIQISDHGMINFKYENVLNITQHLDPDTYELAGSSPFLHIIPTKDNEADIYEKVKNVSLTNNHFQVFKRNDLPDSWHLKKTNRCPPIIALADPGYAFQDIIDLIQAVTKNKSDTINPLKEFGSHGYINTELNMAGYFMARGPVFKKNYRVPPFRNIDLYHLFNAVLKIPPAPNNGSFHNIQATLLIPDDSGDNSIFSLFLVFVGGAILTIICLGCVGYSMLCLMKNKKEGESITRGEKRYSNDLDITMVALQARKNREAQQLLISDSESS